MLRGAVLVPMDDTASAEFAQRVAILSNARLIVSSRKHAEIRTTPVLILDELQRELRRHSAENYEGVELGLADRIEIVFTSGTTAEPKGVVITHGNVLANLEPLEREIERYLKYEHFVHPIRFLNLLPLSHVFGQFLGIFLPPLLGATVVFQEELKPAEVLSTIKRERISVVVSVPRVLQSLKSQIERTLEAEGKLAHFRRQFLASAGKHFLVRWWIFRQVHRRFGWKFWAFISGGAALDRETEEFWGRLGYAVIQGYGLTETTSLVSVNHPFRLGSGSIGKVLAGRELKVAPDGEILIRGGGVAAGYWNAAGQVDTVSGEEGWYHTGDLGALDDSGNLYFRGRKKEVIVTPAGMNVHPADLEAALRQQPEVKDCVVVGVEMSQAAGDLLPCAVLILNSGASGNDAAKIVASANLLLAEYQRIRRWYLWPEHDFPRTATQKPLRNQIAQTVVRHFNSGDFPIPGDSDLQKLISRVTGRNANGAPQAASQGADLDLSSLDRVELISAMEERYQVDLGEVNLGSLNTVGDLERVLQGKPPAAARFHYPQWAQHWPVTWIRLLSNYLLLRPAILLLGWPRVEGRENLRGLDGPVLVVCNHIAHVDVGFVTAALPHRLGNRLATATGGEALESLRTPAADRNLFGKIYDRLGWILGVSLLNLFPLPRQSGVRQSFAYAGECVDRGYSVLIFPEGRHTEDGKLLPFRSGAGLLANNLRIPVVPMRIDGLFGVKQAGRRFAWPGEVRIKIGSPVVLSLPAEPESIAQKMRKAISQL
jgi:long-chain acyl-CoA synthetase